MKPYFLLKKCKIFKAFNKLSSGKKLLSKNWGNMLQSGAGFAKFYFKVR